MNPLQQSLAYRIRQAQQAQAQQPLLEQEAARSTMSQILQPVVGSVGNTIGGGFLGLGQFLGTGIEALTPFNGIGQDIRNTATDWRYGMEDAINNSEFSTIARPGENSFVTNVSSGLGSLLAALALRKASGSSTLPAATFGASAAGQQAQGAIDAGKSPIQAMLTGGAAGGLEAGLEKVGLDKFMGAGGTPVSRFLTRSATEGVQEALQSGAQSAVQSTYTDVDPLQAAKQALIEGGYGAITGGLGDVSMQFANQAGKRVKPLNQQGSVNNSNDPFASFSNQNYQPTTGDTEIDSKVREIVDMTPDEYLQQAFQVTDGSLGGDFESWLASNAKEPGTTQKYAEDMQKGDKFPIPYIDKAMGSQDGRNRALAAKLAGQETIPVGIIPEMSSAEKTAFLEGKVAEYPENSYLGNKYRRQLADMQTEAPTKYNAAQVDESIANMPNVDPRVKMVQANSLKLGAGTEGGYDNKKLDFYRQQFQEGKSVEPIIVEMQGGEMRVTDGKHRLEAAQTLGIAEIPVIVQKAKQAKSSKMSPLELAIKEAKNFANTGEYIKSVKSKGYDIGKGVEGVPYARIFQAAQKQGDVVKGEALKTRLQPKQEQKADAESVRERLLGMYKSTDPAMQMRTDTLIRDVFGNKGTLKKGEVVEAHQLTDGKVLVEDGKEWLLTQKAYQNLKEQAVIDGEQPEDFAPELAKTKTVVQDGKSTKYTEDEIESVKHIPYVMSDLDKDVEKNYNRLAKKLEKLTGLESGKIGHSEIVKAGDEAGMDKEAISKLSSDWYQYMPSWIQIQKTMQGRWEITYKDGHTVRAPGEYTKEEAVQRYGITEDKDRNPDTQYSEYKLGGGDNYREILITADGSEAAPFEFDWEKPSPAVTRLAYRGSDYAIIKDSSFGNGRGFDYSVLRNGAIIYDADSEQQAKDYVENLIKDSERQANEFSSGHWSTKNVVAHLRMDEREANDGSKVSFVEEIQSDWALDGRRKGFQGEIELEIKKEPQEGRLQYYEIIPTNETGDSDTKSKTYLKVMSEKAVQSYKASHPDVRISNFAKSPTLVEDYWAEGRKVDIIDLTEDLPDVYNIYKKKKNEKLYSADSMEDAERAMEMYKRDLGTPKNELLKNWQELTLKKALKEAVDNDADYLAWTTGAQQQDRYNLSQQVNYIKYYKPGSDFNKTEFTIVDISTPNRNIELTVDPKTSMIVVSSMEQAQGKPLEEVIGGSLAKKIQESTEVRGTLEGEDLRIGGEWAKNLYDKQIPVILKKLTGQETEMLSMGTDYKEDERYDPTPYQDYNGDEFTSDTATDLDVGDNVMYEGMDYQVYKVENGQVYMAEADSVRTFDVDDDIREMAESDISDGESELEDYLEKGITPTKAQDLLDSGDFNGGAEALLRAITAQDEKINNDNLSGVRDTAYYDQIESIGDWYYDDFAGTHGYADAYITENGRAWVVEDGADMQEFGQPDQYDLYEDLASDLSEQPAIKLTPEVKRRIKGLPAEVKKTKKNSFAEALAARLKGDDKELYGAALQAHIAKKPK